MYSPKSSKHVEVVKIPAYGSDALRLTLLSRDFLRKFKISIAIGLRLLSYYLYSQAMFAKGPKIIPQSWPPLPNLLF